LVEIQDGALFASDIHYAPYRNRSLRFFEYLLENPPPQLFLLGDIFDLLTPCKYQIEQNREVIDILNLLSKKTEIYYFEGNHDIGMDKILPSIISYKRAIQPISFSFKNKKILISHGDNFGDFAHEFYMNLVSNRAILFLLNKIDDMTGGYISKKITSSIKEKNLCREIAAFSDIMKKRGVKMAHLEGDLLIEGHFHKEVFIKKLTENLDYLNIGSLACNESFFVVKSGQTELNLEKCGL